MIPVVRYQFENLIQLEYFIHECLNIYQKLKIFNL